MIVGPIKARSVCSHHLCLMLGKDWNSASAYPFAALASLADAASAGRGARRLDEAARES